MCWVLALILLVPLLVASVSVSSVMLGMSLIGIGTHQSWLKLTSLLFVGQCYYLCANDIHTEKDREMTPWGRLYSMITMPDVGFGSGPELTMFMTSLIALSHAPFEKTTIAFTSLAVVTLCIIEWKRRFEKSKQEASRRARRDKAPSAFDPPMSSGGAWYDGS